MFVGSKREWYVVAMDYAGRQKALLAALENRKVGALMVTHLPNVQYLCGFTGSAGVLATAAGRFAFFTDGRYTEQAHAEVKNARVVISRNSAITAATDWVRSKGASKAGVEADHIAFSMLSAVRKTVGSGVRVVPVQGMIERQRMIKEPAEIKLISAAVLAGAQLLDVAVEAIRPGVQEVAVAAEMEYAARRSGASSMSFETIVASGKRSALPHGRASEARIPSKGFVVLDFGVILTDYCSDMTRTVHVGRASTEERRIYDAVRHAQQAAVDAVAPGVTAGEIDAAARKVLSKAGLGRYFTHSTGHGVGLEVHEPPRIGHGAQDVLEPGMVITIEPGAYVPERGGVRIEDMVVVTERGCEVLTPCTKELIEV